MKKKEKEKLLNDIKYYSIKEECDEDKSWNLALLYIRDLIALNY